MSTAALRQAPTRAAGSRARSGQARSSGVRAKTSPESRVIRRTVGAPGAKLSGTTSGKPAATDAVRRRRIVVFGGLVAVLTVTSALLLAMQPAQLAPDAVKSLMSLSTPGEIDSLFDTQVPLREGHWRYIYVHHSGPPSAPGAVKGVREDTVDHFFIGNGDGTGDGEVRVSQRWNGQQSAGKIHGMERVGLDVVSICLAGDLDQSPPTPRQMEQLAHLVTSLQNKLQIGRDRVKVMEDTGPPAGPGRYFPRDAFRGGLLP